MQRSRLISALRKTLGRAVIYRGLPCYVLELLEDEPTLVLRVEGARRMIQDNQYGDPQRRVAEIISLPCLDAEGNDLHPELTALGLLGN